METSYFNLIVTGLTGEQEEEEEEGMWPAWLALQATLPHSADSPPHADAAAVQQEVKWQWMSVGPPGVSRCNKKQA